MQLLDWPDFGVPSSTRTVRDMCLMLNEFKKRYVLSPYYNTRAYVHTHLSNGASVLIDTAL